ncbi:MAG TPA: 4Fe-4S double cluster binding domain-containing protein [Clostridia bacterium]|nr:4Fe-4S double cluster binding domain-containing protein [Clostridia bacterium]
MVELIKNELQKLGNKAEVVPVSFYEHIRKDANALGECGFLNKYQEGLVNGVFNYDLSAAGFRAGSIIIVASPSPSTVTVAFNLGGKRIPLRIPSTYVDYNSTPVVLEAVLNKIVNQAGYHVASAQKLPKKWLAVRSGLGIYGRNNICYVEGLGSFATLSAFFSDMPCNERKLYELRQMDVCRSCRVCINNCPTGAIRQDRFLTDTERCLTYFNEAAGEHTFPDWVAPSAHNSVVGCTRCQLSCPVNKKYINDRSETFEFSEEDTGMLLSGLTFEQLPEELAKKIDKLNMRDYFSALPRNLKVLMDKEDITA